MRRFLFLLMALPVFANAQVSKKVKSKTTVQKTVAKKPTTTKLTPVAAPATFTVTQIQPPGGFIVTGTTTGYPDGTEIKMLNGQTGAPEQSVLLNKGKFIVTGKMAGASPEFKLIGVNGQEPFITLFIGNENVSLQTSKDNFGAAVITGSPSQKDFDEFNKVSKPYEELLMGRGRFDPPYMDEAATVLSNFVDGHKDSYVSPLVIFRHNQINHDPAKLESLYTELSDRVKTSPISLYLADMISKNKEGDYAYGKMLADFTQADTSGKSISLSSFRGKYVLVDFWASWCGPCRAENPNLVNSFEKYKNKNFTVLGVSLDREKQPWVNAINNDHLAWTHVSDLQAWGNAVAKQFGINQIPQNFLLDPNGNVIGRNLRGAELEYKLYKLFH